MLFIVLLTVLVALLEVSLAQHDSIWSKRYVVNTRRSHGVVPRQMIHEGLLNMTSAGGTGIIPLALASDQRYAPLTSSVPDSVAGIDGYRFTFTVPTLLRCP
jgi:hypothetical protein